MNEHGWPGWPDDPTGGDAHDGGLHDGADAGLYDGADATPDRGWLADDPWDNADGSPTGGAHHDGGDEPAPAGHDAPEPAIPGNDDGHLDAGDPVVTGTHPTMGPVGADPDAAPDADGPGPTEPFPPALDVGDLPEPVDGFPWIDTGTLGVVAGVVAGDAAPVTSDQLGADLAAYAATDLPPGADPWAEFAASDDPAISALARWWTPGP